MHGPLTHLGWLLLVLGCSRQSPPSPGGLTENVASVATPAASAATPAAPSQETLGLLVATPPPPRPVSKLPENLNVLLLTIDSLRHDMPWSGYSRPIAPRLTELEKRSVSYTRGYALSSYTSMSVGGFLAGEYPSSLKRDGFFFGTYPKEVLMFPERLQAAGIRTLSVQGHGYFKPGTGLSQGFDVWKIVPGLTWNAQTDENVTGPKMEAMAEELLSDPNNTGRPFFAWFHFLDPHDQYMPHKECTNWGKKARDLYDGEVEFTDLQIGKLLDFIEKQPWASRTAIIVSADHGESFGEHGVYRHGFEVYENLVHVPWFFFLPGVPPRRIDVPRSHLDLAPTILELMGVKNDPPLRGASLVPELLGQVQPMEHDIIVDLPRTSDNDRRRALISGKYKLIAFGDDAYYHLYNLEVDPEEKNNLIKTEKETAAAMIQKYKAVSDQIREVKPYACEKLKGTPANP
ncbi:MAG: sulfatase [Myxococcales bacterium]|nr:sulfatase [Polyangiaceae bacterium]MDW8249784.1 sulfatase [Myxococcales bacterium]